MEEVKIFGLQYKRLGKGIPDRWHIDKVQYHQLMKYDWIYYALPQVTSIKQRRNILHLRAFVTANSMGANSQDASSSNYFSVLTSELGFKGSQVRYARWGGFVQNLFACQFGWAPASVDEIISIFNNNQDLQQLVADIYILSPKGPGRQYVSDLSSSLLMILEKITILAF